MLTGSCGLLNKVSKWNSLNLMPSWNPNLLMIAWANFSLIFDWFWFSYSFLLIQMNRFGPSPSPFIAKTHWQTFIFSLCCRKRWRTLSSTANICINDFTKTVHFVLSEHILIYFCVLLCFWTFLEDRLSKQRKYLKYWWRSKCDKNQDFCIAFQ